MGFVLSAATLGLAWFAAVNVLLSAIVWALIRYAGVHARGLGASALFALRVLPAASGALFTLALVVPAHWLYEPRDVDERFAASVWATAAAGAALLGTALRRALEAVRRSQRVRGLWEAARGKAAGPVEIEGLPNLALAGIVWPTVCVGRPVRLALTEPELAVALDHEYAHLRYRDNLKRFLMTLAPDVLRWTREGRVLDDAWAAQAEWQADARAVRGDARRAIDLASALVKVARLSSTAPELSPAWSALHERSLLDMRVRRLVSGAVPPIPYRQPAAPLVGALAVASIAAAWWAGAGLTVHLLTERLIRLLP